MQNTRGRTGGRGSLGVYKLDAFSGSPSPSVGRVIRFFEEDDLEGKLNKNSHWYRVFDMIPGKMSNSTQNN